MKRLLEGLKRYVRTCVEASTRVSFYRRIEERKVGDAVGHLAVLVAALWIVPLAVEFFLAMRNGLEAFNTGLRTRVPPGTVFEMKDGLLTSTLAGPLVFRDASGLVVIIDAASGTAELAEGEAGLIVHADSLVQKDASGRYEVLPFSQIPDFRVTREEIGEWVGRYAPLVILLASVMIILGSAVGFAFAVGGMAALYGAVVWLAAKIARRPWPYRRAFLVAAYAATVPVTAKALFGFAGFDGGFVPIALYWILLGAVLYDAAKKRGDEGHERKEPPSAVRPRPEGQAGPV